MEIKILAKDVNLTKDLKSYIETKMEAINSKLGLLEEDEERICNFRIGTKSASRNKGNTYFAEASIKTAHKNFGALAKANSLEAAIDELKDELAKKVRRYKGKRETKIKRGGRAVKKMLRKLMK